MSDGSASIELGQVAGENNVAYQPDYLEETIPSKAVDANGNKGETRYA